MRNAAIRVTPRGITVRHMASVAGYEGLTARELTFLVEHELPQTRISSVRDFLTRCRPPGTAPRGAHLDYLRIADDTSGIVGRERHFYAQRVARLATNFG